MSCVIYAIVNIKNGRKYIGSSTHIETRLKYHYSKLRKNNHPNYRLQSDYAEYGADSFKTEILEILDDTGSRHDAYMRESYYIKLFGGVNGDLYNLRDADLTGEISNDTKLKMSKSIKQGFIDGSRNISGVNNPMFGQGHKVSGCKNGTYGKPVELSRKIKISNSLLKRGGTKILQFDLNGNLLNSFNSMRAAERFTGIQHARISEYIRGIPTDAGPFVWRLNNE